MTDNTVLLRQVSDRQHDQGNLNFKLFHLRKEDEGDLSVYNSDRITAKDALEHFTKVLRCQSDGIVGLTVAECKALNLPAREDPDTFWEHAVISFKAYGDKIPKTISIRLRELATERKWILGPLGAGGKQG